MVGSEEVTRVEKRPRDVLEVIVADRTGEDLKEILDAHSRRAHPLKVVEGRMNASSVDVAPLIAKHVRIKAVHIEAIGAIPVERRHRIGRACKQHVHGLTAQLCGVEAIKQDRPPPPLRMADFPRENGRAGRLAPPLTDKVIIADSIY